MQGLVKRLLESAYARNIITLVSGASLSQVILLAITPILTRVFTPDEFGVYGAFFAVVSILVLLVTGRYELAILLPKDEQDAIKLFWISSSLALIICTSFYLFLPFVIPYFEHFTQTSIREVQYWLPLAIFLLAIAQSAGFLANRQKRYKQLSYSRIIGSSTTGMTSMLLGFAKLTSTGLIIGKFLGLIFETGALLWPLRKGLKYKKGSGRSFKTLMKQYRNFPLFSVPEALVNTSYRQLPVILMTGLFSPGVAGYYALAYTIVTKPLGLVGTAFMQVFFQRAAELNDDSDQSLESLFLKNLRALFLLAIIPCLVLALVAPPVFEFILGEGWRTTGIYTRWLMPLLFFTFLKSPLSAMVDIKNKIGQNILFEALLLILTLLAFYVGFRQKDPLLAVQLYSLSCSLIVIVQLYWFYRLTKLKSSWN